MQELEGLGQDIAQHALGLGPDGLGSDKEEAAKGVVTVVTHVARIGMPLAELVDLEKEKARIAKALKKNQGELDKLNNKLKNPGFLAKAPENVVKTEQERAEKLAALIAQLVDIPPIVAGFLIFGLLTIYTALSGEVGGLLSQAFQGLVMVFAGLVLIIAITAPSKLPSAS